eukprot:scaffold61783_cov21-Tisochrysis_lutea.AAC.2
MMQQPHGPSSNAPVNHAAHPARNACHPFQAPVPVTPPCYPPESSSFFPPPQPPVAPLPGKRLNS